MSLKARRILWWAVLLALVTFYGFKLWLTQSAGDQLRRDTRALLETAMAAAPDRGVTEVAGEGLNLFAKRLEINAKMISGPLGWVPEAGLMLFLLGSCVRKRCGEPSRNPASSIAV